MANTTTDGEANTSRVVVNDDTQFGRVSPTYSDAEGSEGARNEAGEEEKEEEQYIDHPHQHARQHATATADVTLEFGARQVRIKRRPPSLSVDLQPDGAKNAETSQQPEQPDCGSGSGSPAGKKQRTVHPCWIIFGVLTLLVGVVVFMAMSMLLHALEDVRCPGFTAIGGVILPVGFILAFVGLLALRCRSIQYPVTATKDERQDQYKTLALSQSQSPSLSGSPNLSFASPRSTTQLRSRSNFAPARCGPDSQDVEMQSSECDLYASQRSEPPSRDLLSAANIVQHHHQHEKKNEGTAAASTRGSSRCAKGGKMLAKGLGALCILALYALFLLICAVGIAVYIMSRSAPDVDINYSGGANVTGTVRITRDESGFPHIVADTRRDAYFGQGFVHAQDRLFQLELLRLAAQGRVSEYLGSAALPTDKALRALGLRKRAKVMCDAASAHNRDFLLAYTEGLNYYLLKDKKRPPEFMFMGPSLLIPHEPQKFVVEDMCETIRLMQWGVTTNYYAEIGRWLVYSKVGLSHRQVTELYPNYTNVSSTVLSPADLNLTEADAVAARAREARDFLLEEQLYDEVMWKYRESEPEQQPTRRSFAAAAAADEHGQQLRKAPNDGGSWPFSSIHNFVNDLGKGRPFGGSNAWMARAKGKKPIGASDPHLTVAFPSYWHQSQLTFKHSDDGGKTTTTFVTSGVTLVGLPGVMLGKTSHVSLGLTMTMSDISDFFVMVPDPDAPTSRYLHNGTSVPYGLRHETIKVKGSPSVSMTMRETVYGPVVGQEFTMTKKHFIAVNAAALSFDDNQSLVAIIRSTDPTITTVADVRDKIWALLQSPNLGVAFSDKHGGIGYGATGLHPIRAPGHTGRFPILGNGSYDYRGYIPFPEMPQKIDQNYNSDGFVSCANNKMYPDGYRYSLGYDWDLGDRSVRIRRLLKNASAEGTLGSLNIHKKIQLDTRSNVWMDRIKPALQQKHSTERQFRSLLTPAAAAKYEQLLKWDGFASFGATEPSLLWGWLVEIGKLPEDINRELELTSAFPAVFSVHVVTAPSDTMLRYCAKAMKEETVSNASCTVYMAAKFNEVTAAGQGEREWGTDANRLHIQHMIFTDTLLQCMFDEYIPKDGDASSINQAKGTSWNWDSKLESVYASSMRLLYDFNDPSEKCLFTFPTGASGNRFSPFYDNMASRYSNNEYYEVLVAKHGEEEAASISSNGAQEISRS